MICHIQVLLNKTNNIPKVKICGLKKYIIIIIYNYEFPSPHKVIKSDKNYSNWKLVTENIKLFYESSKYQKIFYLFFNFDTSLIN